MSSNDAPVNKSTGMAEAEQLIEIRGDTENPTLEDIWVAGQPLGKIINSLTDRVDTVENEVQRTDSTDKNPTPDGSETGSQNDELLPIERMAKLKEKNEEHPALPTNGKESFDRALSIYENFRSWSKRTPKGRTVTSGLRTLLETATGTSLAWRQVYRAMDMLERWTNGLIRHEQTNRHGHVLVASERVSSAPTG